MSVYPPFLPCLVSLFLLAWVRFLRRWFAISGNNKMIKEWYNGEWFYCEAVQLPMRKWLYAWTILPRACCVLSICPGIVFWLLLQGCRNYSKNWRTGGVNPPFFACLVHLSRFDSWSADFCRWSFIGTTSGHMAELCRHTENRNP